MYVCVIAAGSRHAILTGREIAGPLKSSILPGQEEAALHGGAELERHVWPHVAVRVVNLFSDPPILRMGAKVR